MVIGFKEVKIRIKESEFYKNHLKEFVSKNKILKEIFDEG